MTDRELRAVGHAKMMLESVIWDEATIEAGLWRGEAIPRAIEMLDDILPPLTETPEARWLRLAGERLLHASPRLLEALKRIQELEHIHDSTCDDDGEYYYSEKVREIAEAAIMEAGQ